MWNIRAAPERRERVPETELYNVWNEELGEKGSLPENRSRRSRGQEEKKENKRVWSSRTSDIQDLR